jgi:hypothetical protein
MSMNELKDHLIEQLLNLIKESHRARLEICDFDEGLYLEALRDVVMSLWVAIMPKDPTIPFLPPEDFEKALADDLCAAVNVRVRELTDEENIW